MQDEKDECRHQYLVHIEENEIEEYEAFLDDIIENAFPLPVSKKRKERTDESFQFEKENQDKLGRRFLSSN